MQSYSSGLLLPGKWKLNLSSNDYTTEYHSIKCQSWKVNVNDSLETTTTPTKAIEKWFLGNDLVAISHVYNIRFSFCNGLTRTDANFSLSAGEQAGRLPKPIIDNVLGSDLHFLSSVYFAPLPFVFVSFFFLFFFSSARATLPPYPLFTAWTVRSIPYELSQPIAGCFFFQHRFSSIPIQTVVPFFMTLSIHF